MKKSLVFLSLFFIISSTYCQLETIEKNGKYGLLSEEGIILKAKYHSITIQDEFIITAFRKKRIFYFNSFGEKIYAGPKSNSAAFEQG